MTSVLWPQDVSEDFIYRQTELIVHSYKRWLGWHLVPPGLSREETAAALWRAPFVCASTDTASDPRLNYGNLTALGLWEMPWSEFTQTPGKHTAEAMERQAREHFLNEVKRHGFIENYSGIRITRTGKRFQIHRAVVWNLIDEKEQFAGQAVFFREWEFI